MVRKLAAHYLIPGNEKPIKNGIITVDGKGKILEISQSTRKLEEVSGLEFYSGILVPGFVNVHCHLELSHLKGKIEQHTGLPGFVSQITKLRQLKIEEIITSIKKADNVMWHKGIVAVGDICNTNHSFETKLNSSIVYHSFLEIFTTDPKKVNDKYEEALKLEKELKNTKLTSSIVPHAPYSVTPKMFELIKTHSLENKRAICIHNQECSSENDLYKTKSGSLFEVFSNLGVNFSAIPETGKNSLESIIQYLPKEIKTLLVHNTFTTKEDIELAESHFNELYWCFCPNANLYIENKLPEIQTFIQKNQKICIGTDSLASNSQLSIIEELKTIQKILPNTAIDKLINWACFNGAQALDLQDKFGSFQKGKSPGINLIRQFDLQNFRFKPESNVKKLA